MPATPNCRCPGHFALNMDLDAAAGAYPTQIIAPMIGRATRVEIESLHEQSSGARTKEASAVALIERANYRPIREADRHPSSLLWV